MSFNRENNGDGIEYKNSRWQDLYSFLAKNDFEVYAPGVKLGECRSPYLVVKEDGSSFHAFASTYVDLYSILIYVPKQSYSLLDEMVQKVRRTMKFAEPLFYPTGAQTPSFYDEEIKAHTVSLTYKNYKKL